LADDGDLPDYADIDIYCVMDEGHGFPQRKFRYQGALLETVSQPLSAYRSPEEVLSNPFLAHRFRTNGILADPEGLLEPIYRTVRDEFAQPQWLRARYEKLKSVVQAVVNETDSGENVDDAFPTLFRTLRLLSNLILIAHLQPPTVRTSNSRARRILVQMGNAPLAEEMLALLGSDAFTPDQVRASLEECVKAFDRAVAVYRTPISPGFNLDPAVRPYLIEGTEEMIRSGEHREAMLWISVMHWTANRALQNDAPEDEKLHWQASIHEMYASLRLNDLSTFRQRLRFGEDVAAKIIELMDGVVERYRP
jgi:hypothetical protein